MDLKRTICPMVSIALPASWLLAHGVSLRSAAMSVVLIALQITIGVWALQLPFKETGTPLSEQLVLGAPVGFVLTTVLDLILVTAGFAGLSFLSLLFLSLFSVYFSRKFWVRVTRTNHDLSTPILTSCAAIILGRGSLTDGWLISLLVLTLGTSVIYVRPRFSPAIRTLVASSVFLLSCLSSWNWHPKIEYANWFLYPLYTGTDDNIFSESLSSSLAQFGLQDFAASSGVTNRYHFFSLAWSGITSRLAGLEPFVMTLHVVPMVAFSLTACLVWLLTSKLTRSRRACVLAIAVLFASNSLPEQFRFFHTNTTSNTLSHIWFLAALITAINLLQRQGSLQWLLLSMLSTSVVLAKAPYGVVLLSGIATLFLMVLVSQRRDKSLLLLSLLPSLILPSIAALVFLRPVEWSQRRYHFRFNEMRLAAGISTHILIIIAGIGLIVFARVAGSVWSRPHKSGTTSNRLSWALLMGSSASGLISFALDGNSAERYFLSAGLVASAPLTAIGIDRALGAFKRTFPQDARSPLMLVGVASVCILVHLLIERIMHTSISDRFLPGVPIISALTSCVILTLLIRPNIHKSFRVIALSSTIISMAISSAVTYVQIAIKPNPYSFTETVADTRDLEALAWLKKESGPSDLIATNRYLCHGPISCQFDDSGMLISAVAQRRVYIEGPRFVVGGRPYPEWVTERINRSLDFVANPSSGALQQLLGAGVTWFYLDKMGEGVTATRIAAIKSLASDRYENDRVIIFNLME